MFFSRESRPGGWFRHKRRDAAPRGIVGSESPTIKGTARAASITSRWRSQVKGQTSFQTLTAPTTPIPFFLIFCHKLWLDLAGGTNMNGQVQIEKSVARKWKWVLFRELTFLLPSPLSPFTCRPSLSFCFLRRSGSITSYRTSIT